MFDVQEPVFGLEPALDEARYLMWQHPDNEHIIRVFTLRVNQVLNAATAGPIMDMAQRRNFTFKIGESFFSYPHHGERVHMFTIIQFLNNAPPR